MKIDILAVLDFLLKIGQSLLQFLIRVRFIEGKVMCFHVSAPKLMRKGQLKIVSNWTFLYLAEINWLPPLSVRFDFLAIEVP